MTQRLAILAILAVPMLAAAQGLDFKGKMTPGEYEYTVSMEMGKMPGMPEGMQGMKMPPTTFKHCITQKDIDEGNKKMLGRGPRSEDSPDCALRDVKQSGNSASFKMSCKGEVQMEMDTVMTFTGNGYRMNSKMTGNQGGQPMNMNQTIEVKHLGPCKK